MKRIYLIGGTMGVGKTSVCQTLKKILSLICNRDELAKRLEKDIKAGIRQEDVIA